MDIRITDDRREMIQLGREIVASKPHVYTEKMCADIMKVIEENRPEASEAEKQDIFFHSIYNYWVYGSNIAEEFSYDFLNKAHAEKCEYIGSRDRFRYIHHLNKKEDAYLLNDKFTTYSLLKPYYKRDVIKIESEADFEIFSEFVDKHPVFVAKPAALGISIGVHRVDSREYPDKMTLMRELLAEGVTTNASYNWCNSNAIVLEELIQQHEALAKLHPASVNGIRVTTVRVGDTVYIYHPWFKIGADGNFVTSVEMGTMDAGIDAETGIVNTLGCKEDGTKLEFHPQTNVRIPGYVIPEWEALIQTATELAMQFQTIRYIGWDLVLTPNNGWCVMEGNFAGEFMWQMVYGKGMKREFEELIGWKPAQQFWWEK